MATATEVVSAKPREGKFNKNAARRVRVAGKIPGVIYGAKEPAIALELDPKQMQRILHSETGHNTIFDVSISDGARVKAMIVDWQYEPIKDKLIHVDLKRIAMDKMMRVEVPIVLEGTATGVKVGGGVLELVLREVEIECLPSDIPSSITVDVTNLGIGDSIRVADLPHDKKFKFISDEDETVAHVISIREEVVPDVAAVAAATPAQPEVAKKGKTDAEGDAAAPAKGAKK
jgi:large subunit ribosomal protein L25